MSKPSQTVHRPPFVHSSTSYNEHHQSRSQSPRAMNQVALHHMSTPSTSSLPAYDSAPYTDFPNEKADLHQLSGDSSSSWTYPTSDRSHNDDRTHHPHHVVYQQQDRPTRGIYGHRRTPSAMDDAISAGRSRANDLKAKICGREGSGLGRALILGWVITTVMFIGATAFWKGELFTALDNLSKELKEMGYQGQAIFGFLIFITTIPPLPLYSTFMVLAGYTFGASDGFVISYVASLLGAVIVFVVSRNFLKDCITHSLSSSPTCVQLLNIVSSRPHLLLLIRIAPYPYNLLNVILASSQNLSLRTYTSCTALSLLKVILHCWFGAGLHDLSELHSGKQHDDPADRQRDEVKRYCTWAGVLLCVGLFVYLHHVAKKAIKRAQDEVADQQRDGRLEAGMETSEVQLRQATYRC